MKDSASLFTDGLNCAQSVFVPFAQQLNIDEETAKKLSIALGAGVGRMRNVCGAFSALAMLAGLKFSKNDTPENKKRIYQITQKLAEIFKEKNGSIICAELLKLKEGENLSPTPQSRDAQYYKTRPCLAIVQNAAEIAKEQILSGKIAEEIDGK